ncbi:zinc finger MYM-type protein 1 [Trichonephila clavipes]|nr:zinc finger MYM-type protein 1 [Trichonephila clavipes]
MSGLSTKRDKDKGRKWDSGAAAKRKRKTERVVYPTRFLVVTETTGEYLTDAIQGEVEKNGLDNQNCRGQGCDNGANMIGVYCEVKPRILNRNPMAFFTPCGCRSWNLLFARRS